MNIVIWAVLIFLTLLFLYIVYCSIVGQRPLAYWEQDSQRQVAIPVANPMPETLIPLQIPNFSSLQLQLRELAEIAWTTAPV